MFRQNFDDRFRRVTFSLMPRLGRHLCVGDPVCIGIYATLKVVGSLLVPQPMEFGEFGSVVAIYYFVRSELVLTTRRCRELIHGFTVLADIPELRWGNILLAHCNVQKEEMLLQVCKS
ncbi:hypothetical protein PG990_010175 [Apiospora arundinis]